MSQEGPLTAPGWYADPDDPQQRRYFNGREWSSRVLGPSGKPLGPAGWYPDPEAIGGQRYYDGLDWTDQRLSSWHSRLGDGSTFSLRGLMLLFAGLVGLSGLSAGSRLIAAGNALEGTLVLAACQVVAFGIYLWPWIAKRT